MKVITLATAVAAAAVLLAPAVAAEPAPIAADTAQPAPGSDDSGNLSSEAKSAVAGVNAFSLDLYKRSLKPDDNLFLSPASVSTAMTLAYRGAVGKTADELRRVMHYDAAPDAYLRASGELFATMNVSGEGHMLQTANAIWVQDGMPLIPDYLADVQNYMKAGLQRTDFSADPEKARGNINDWVATATHDRITDLLQKGIVTDQTRAVLVNAIYWKGRWEAPFDVDDTKQEPFTRLDGAQQPTKLMHRRSDFAVVERGGVQAIELPYDGDDVGMVVFLPDSPDGLPGFEDGLSARELTRWFGALDAAHPRETVLTLPKMHLEWQHDLKGTLSGMGAPTAFSDGANFSGMATLPYPGGNPLAGGLTIAHVIHKAWLDVDEEGAEAAAATGVVMTEEIVVAERRPPPVVFRADKPFLFVLRDRRTGLILFMGRYVAPPKLD
jgi:serpin B